MSGNGLFHRRPDCDEEVAITVTKSGYIKRTPVTTILARDAAARGALARWPRTRITSSIFHRFDARIPDDLYRRTDWLQDEGPRSSGCAAARAARRIVNLIQILRTKTGRRRAGARISEGRFVLMVRKKA